MISLKNWSIFIIYNCILTVKIFYHWKLKVQFESIRLEKVAKSNNLNLRNAFIKSLNNLKIIQRAVFKIDSHRTFSITNPLTNLE